MEDNKNTDSESNVSNMELRGSRTFTNLAARHPYRIQNYYVLQLELTIRLRNIKIDCMVSEICET